MDARIYLDTLGRVILPTMELNGDTGYVHLELRIRPRRPAYESDVLRLGFLSLGDLLLLRATVDEAIETLEPAMAVPVEALCDAR